MRNVAISFFLLILVVSSPAVFASGSIVSPGVGFILTMDDLVNISASQGTDTVVKGATQVGGFWDYFIEGQVTILADDELIISPGERLVFRPDFNSNLEIQGQLDASGAAVDDIILTSLADYFLTYKGVQSVAGWTNIAEIWTAEDQVGNAAWMNLTQPSERNYRVAVKADSLFAYGTQVRVMLEAHALFDTVFEGASIGIRSGTCNLLTASRLTFAGNDDVLITGGGFEWSDWVNFQIREAEDYLVHLKVPANHNVRYLSEPGGDDHQYLRNSADDDTEETTDLSKEYFGSNQLSSVAAVQARIPNVWMTLLPSRPDAVFFDEVMGVRESSFNTVNAEFEWYWADSILYLFSPFNPGLAYANPGIRVGYLPIPGGFGAAASAAPQASAEEALMVAALTSDMTTHKGLFAITSVSGVTGPAPGAWDSLTFRFLSGQPRSVVRYVTIRAADIGINCFSVPEDALTIEQCTIEWNHTGIFLNNASPLITDNRNISYNMLQFGAPTSKLRTTGCAIFMTGNSTPVVKRNNFIGNQGNTILLSGKGVAPFTPLPKLGNVLDPEDPGENNFLIHYNDPPFNTEAGRVGQRHVYNETANTIYARQNFWGVSDPSFINSTLIYDDTQDSESGPVLFQPFFLTPRTGVAEDTWGGYR